MKKILFGLTLVLMSIVLLASNYDNLTKNKGGIINEKEHMEFRPYTGKKIIDNAFFHYPEEVFMGVPQEQMGINVHHKKQILWVCNEKEYALIKIYQNAQGIVFAKNKLLEWKYEYRYYSSDEKKEIRGAGVLTYYFNHPDSKNKIKSNDCIKIGSLKIIFSPINKDFYGIAIKSYLFDVRILSSKQFEMFPFHP